MAQTINIKAVKAMIRITDNDDILDTFSEYLGNLSPKVALDMLSKHSDVFEDDIFEFMEQIKHYGQDGEGKFLSTYTLTEVLKNV